MENSDKLRLTLWVKVPAGDDQCLFDPPKWEPYEDLPPGWEARVLPTGTYPIMGTFEIVKDRIFKIGSSLRRWLE